MRQSENADDVTPTASMIKAWLVADHLRLYGQDQRLSSIIRDSTNEPAWEIYAKLGRERSIERLIAMAGLTDSAPGEDLRMTLMSARDAVRMGQSLADGDAAGPEWTNWLLDEIRAVHGIGDFGIQHAFPEATLQRIVIKNGWEIRHAEAEWNVNCLAVDEGWIMAILTRYPSSLPLGHGAETCIELAMKLVC